MIHLFEIGWLPNAFEPNKVIFSFITASLIGANGAYVPIFTCAWYDTSVVSSVWQFAITVDGVKDVIIQVRLHGVIGYRK